MDNLDMSRFFSNDSRQAPQDVGNSGETLRIGQTPNITVLVAENALAQTAETLVALTRIANASENINRNLATILCLFTAGNVDQNNLSPSRAQPSQAPPTFAREGSPPIQNGVGEVVPERTVSIGDVTNVCVDELLKLTDEIANDKNQSPNVPVLVTTQSAPARETVPDSVRKSPNKKDLHRKRKRSTPKGDNSTSKKKRKKENTGLANELERRNRLLSKAK
jgi:hypothetical protein